jgi:hypothetical protein
MTKSAMAMSLQSVAWRNEPGQSWLAAQNKKAAAKMIALSSSSPVGPRAVL